MAKPEAVPTLTDEQKAERHDENIKKIKSDVSDLLEEALSDMYKKACLTHENQGVTASIKLTKNRAGEWMIKVKAQANLHNGQITREVQMLGSQLSIYSAV